jgi:ADP-heptose:LPS heptosyltransferase
MDLNEKFIPIILNCEGLGDTLYSIPVIKKLHQAFCPDAKLLIFTRHPSLFMNCPYIEKAYGIHETTLLSNYPKHLVLFNSPDLPHSLMDTFDYISIPLGIGELSFREKQLEYFPLEDDHSDSFDVVINTSFTWPSRSWPVENWQKIADFLIENRRSVAVVGKDIFSKADNIWKKSQSLQGCVDLTNRLSLDQTYYTINKCGLFLTCQNGLSVLSGTTDTEIIVLDMSIEWSKRAVFRQENPHYKITYAKGNCNIYCCEIYKCSLYDNFKCIPTVEMIIDLLQLKLDFLKKHNGNSQQ